MGGKSSSKAKTDTTAKTQNLNNQGNTAPLGVPSVDIKGGKRTDARVDLTLDQSKTLTALKNVGNVTKTNKLDNVGNTTTTKITTTDHGAIKNASETANKSIGMALDISSKSLEHYEEINRRSLDSIAGANDGVLEFAAAAIDKNNQVSASALDFADTYSRTDETSNFKTMAKWAVVGLGVYMIGKTF